MRIAGGAAPRSACSRQEPCAFSWTRMEIGADRVRETAKTTAGGAVAAYIIFEILWQGSRVFFPPRNFIPPLPGIG